jgi:predicted ATPase with chaperone activity
MTRNLIITTWVLLLAPLALLAQPGSRGKEAVQDRIRAQRIAIYTDVLKLTSTEAEGFWPVYNKFLEDRETVQDQMKSIRRDNLSDAESEEQLKKFYELKQKELDLEKDMVQKLRKVIPLQKILKIPDAEREFRRTVLERARERREERGRG